MVVNHVSEQRAFASFHFKTATGSSAPRSLASESTGAMTFSFTYFDISPYVHTHLQSCANI